MRRAFLFAPLLALALFVLAGAPATFAHALDYTPSGSPYNWSDGLADGWTLATTTTVVPVNTSYHRLSGDGTAAFDAQSPSYSPLATVTGATVSFCNGGPYVVSSANTTVSLVVGGTSYPGTLSNSTASLPAQCTNLSTDHYATVTWSGLSIASGASVRVHINSYVAASGVLVGNVGVLLATAAPSAGGTGSLSFPSLDMTSISTQMAGFFGFLAPALWIVVGISLGGLLVARVRNLL